MIGKAASFAVGGQRPRILLAAVVMVVGVALPGAPTTVAAATASGPHIRPIPGTLATYGVSCPTATLCWAVGTTGDTADHGVGFIDKVVDGIPGPEISIPTTTALSVISCPTATFCEVVGAAVPTATSGATALIAFHNGKASAVHHAPGGTWYNSVSCASAKTCRAVGYTNAPQIDSYPIVQTITNGRPGTTRTMPKATAPASQLGGIDCLPSGACVAVGQGVYGAEDAGAQTILVRITPAGVPSLPSFSPAYNIADQVACVTITTCYAVGSQSLPDIATSGILIPITKGHFGAVQVIAHNTGAASISCAASRCNAAGYFQPDPNNSAVTNGQLITIDAKGVATAHDVADTAAIGTMSCPVGGPCAAVVVPTAASGLAQGVLTTATHPKRATLTLISAPEHPTKSGTARLTLTVKKRGGNARASGDVTFAKGKKVLCRNVALRAQKSNAAAVCKVRGATLGVGKGTVRATYAGDANYLPGSATAKVNVRISK
jgi:Bacterial Ig-like domain (group 3)